MLIFLWLSERSQGLEFGFASPGGQSCICRFVHQQGSLHLQHLPCMQVALLCRPHHPGFKKLVLQPSMLWSPFPEATLRGCRGLIKACLHHDPVALLSCFESFQAAAGRSVHTVPARPQSCLQCSCLLPQDVVCLQVPRNMQEPRHWLQSFL